MISDFGGALLNGVAQAAAGITCALANPAFSPKELEHAINVSRASHMLVDASALPLVCETLQAMGLSSDEIRRRVVVMSSDAETPAEHKARGWVALDRLDFTPVASVPERFDGDHADATALIYFSSGAFDLVIFTI